jgi:hypothetical protein
MGTANRKAKFPLHAARSRSRPYDGRWPQT